MSTTVIVEYEDGAWERYPGYHVDCWVDWDSGKLRLVKQSSGDVREVKEINMPDEISCIKERNPDEGNYIVWTNPKYNYAVSINVEKVEI